MTSTRSAMPSTSGSSLEIISTATPRPASSLSRRCTSAFVPTSMPRVGSSTISTCGSVASHLASTTFCWLPPERTSTGSRRRWYLSCRRAAHSSASAVLVGAEDQPEPRERAQPGERRVARDGEVHHEALLAAVLGHEADAGPHRRAAGGRAAAAGRRPRRGPRPRRSMPKTARATSLRPAPTSPASATISPARTEKLTSKKTPSRVRRSTRSTGVPISAGCLGNSVLSSRPTIRRTISSGVDVGDAGVVHDRAVAHHRDGVRRRERPPRGGGR